MPRSSHRTAPPQIYSFPGFQTPLTHFDNSSLQFMLISIDWTEPFPFDRTTLTN
jgi:hypothetical protein